LDAEENLTPLTRAGEFLYPNGIVLRGPLLYIAEFRGIFVIDTRAIDTRAGAPAPLATPPEISTSSIDGLYLHKDRLVGVQNGVQPPRLMAYRLAADGQSIITAALLVRGDPRVTDPTTGVIVDDSFYFIANAELDAVNEESVIVNAAGIPQTKILTIDPS